VKRIMAAAAIMLGLAACGSTEASAPVTPVAPANPVAANAVTPLHNDCSAGYVTFTFDGGPRLPSQYGDTPLIIGTLLKLHLKAVFFVIGKSVVENPDIVREEVRDGFSVQNHTWDHADFTGRSAGTKPLSLSQVRRELQRGAQAIVAAGAPAPTLYRPPFDDVTAADNAVAKSLGERIVLSYGDPASRIIDSGDWTHISAKQITHNVIYGSKNEQGNWIPGIRAGSIIGYHDGIPGNAPSNAAYSLQPIVNYMNAHHLCSTTSVPNPADGGVFLPNGGF
jgi:peptidoglycan-N-acetylglucosamine deacetylase